MNKKSEPEENKEYSRIHTKELPRERHKQAHLIADLVEKSGQPFAVSNPDGSLGIYNPAFLELTGYSAEELKSIKWTSVPLTPPEWFESESKALAELESTGKPVRYQKELIRKDGKRVSIELWANILRDGTGRQQYRYAFITDITERKHAEQLLKESREQYRILIDNANEAIVVAQDGYIKFVNRTTFELFPGYSEQELTSKPFTDFVHPDDRARIVENLTKRLKGEPLSPIHQYRLMMHDGVIKWAEIRTALIEWKGKPATLHFIANITERKEAEAKLIESEERFRRVFDEAPIGAAITSSDLHFTRTNEKLRQMFGYSEDEFLGLTFQEINHPEDIAGDVKQIARLERGEIQQYSADKRYLRKDGMPIWGHLSVSPVRDNNNKILYFVPLILDITEQKRAEEEILRLNRLYAIISQVNQAVMRAIDPKVLFDEVCRIVVEKGGFKLAWVGKLEPASQQVITVAASGKVEYVKGISVYADERSKGYGPVGTSIREHRPFIQNDFMNDPNTKPWQARAAEYNFRGTASFPITVGGAVWGALAVYSDIVGYFGEQETALLEETARRHRLRPG